jgi:hypothetical protein
MRYLLTSVAFFLVSGAAYASGAVAPVAPAPEIDLGIAGLVMVAAAAFFARRGRG